MNLLVKTIEDFRKEELCLSLRGFSKKSGISRCTLRKIYKGAEPSLSVYRKLSAITGLPAKTLMLLWKEGK